MDKNKQLEHTRVYLISEYPFYSAMLNQCVFSWSDKLPTAGVCINKTGNVELLINPIFFDSLSEHHRIGLLMHEMLHVAMNHLTRVKEFNQLFNIAMDISINQYIPLEFLPVGGLLPSQYQLPLMKSFEFYYNELKNKKTPPQEKPMDEHGVKPQEGSSDDQIDDQSGELSKDLKEELVKRLVENARSEAESVKPGSTPMHVTQELTERVIEQNKVNWTTRLRSYIGKNFSKDTESTRNRPNRRLGLKSTGTRSVTAPKLLIAMDQSGSISSELINEYLNELKSILNISKDKTEVVFFDTEIAKSLMLNKVTEETSKRYANGGTDFQCAVNYGLKKHVDLLIVFTDGNAPNPVNTKLPVLWVIKGSKNEELKGTKIYL